MQFARETVKFSAWFRERVSRMISLVIMSCQLGAGERVIYDGGNDQKQKPAQQGRGDQPRLTEERWKQRCSQG